MYRLVSALLALALVAGACGDPEDVSSETSVDTTVIEAGPDDAPEVSVPEDETDGATPTTGRTDAADSESSDTLPLEELGGDDSDDSTATTAPTQTETTAAGASGSGSGDADPQLVADLEAAVAAADNPSFTYPFFYLDVTQNCEGCSDSATLYYVPGEENPSRRTLEKAFVNGAEVSVSSVAPFLRDIDPLFAAEFLLLEAGAGKSITYGIDGRTGLASSWSIDGEAASITCMEGDTRPLDRRTSDCGGSIIR